MTDTANRLLQAPHLHLNGSGRERLIEQLTAVHQAAENLLAALREATPHPRDYYPLGDDAFKRAHQEHRARVEKAAGIQNEIENIRMQIVIAAERARPTR